MNIVAGPPANVGFTIEALPTELNALTKRAAGNALLQALHQRFVGTGEVRKHAIDGRAVGDRVRRVDDHLAGESIRARECERVCGH